MDPFQASYHDHIDKCPRCRVLNPCSEGERLLKLCSDELFSLTYVAERGLVALPLERPQQTPIVVPLSESVEPEASADPQTRDELFHEKVDKFWRTLADDWHAPIFLDDTVPYVAPDPRFLRYLREMKIATDFVEPSLPPLGQAHVGDEALPADLVSIMWQEYDDRRREEAADDLEAVALSEAVWEQKMDEAHDEIRAQEKQIEGHIALLNATEKERDEARRQIEEYQAALARAKDDAEHMRNRIKVYVSSVGARFAELEARNAELSQELDAAIEARDTSRATVSAREDLCERRFNKIRSLESELEKAEGPIYRKLYYATEQERDEARAESHARLKQIEALTSENDRKERVMAALRNVALEEAGKYEDLWGSMQDAAYSSKPAETNRFYRFRLDGLASVALDLVEGLLDAEEVIEQFQEHEAAHNCFAAITDLDTATTKEGA